MSNILLKETQPSSISSPAYPGYVNLFSNLSDNGNLYYKDSNGNVFIVGGGGSSPNIIQVTYSDLTTLIGSTNLSPGMFYEITDFQTIYDRPNYFFDGKMKGTIDTGYGSVESLIVFATSNSTLDVNAFQPSYPMDKIKYDVNFSSTEINGAPAKGRIIERIDEYNNRTDFDHREVTFRRYMSYTGTSKLTGKLDGIDLANGTITGNGTSFLSEMSVGNVYLFDSDGNTNFYLGVKISQIIDNTTAKFYTDVYPSWSNTGLNFDIYLASTTDYYDWKEVYVSQEIQGDYSDFKTFQTDSESPVTSVNNYIGDFAQYQMSGNLPIGISHLLPNIVMRFNSYDNNIGNISFNFTLPQSSISNKIEGKFYNNNIYYNFTYNHVINDMWNNYIMMYFNYNEIQGDFYNNFIGTVYQISNFDSNNISEEFAHNYIMGPFGQNKLHRFSSNIIEGNFILNSIGTGFFGNEIALNFGFAPIKDEIGNTIGNFFRGNKIGVIGSVPANFYGNQIGNYFGFELFPIGNNPNIIGSNFAYNIIGDRFRNNTIEDNFRGNKIGSNFNSNTIANNFGYDVYNDVIKGNEIGDNFTGNYIGNIGSLAADFHGNKIGNNFGVDVLGGGAPNSIQGGFTDNTIGENFYSNVIFSDFRSNDIQNRFRGNLVNSGFYGNKVGNDFVSNSIDVNFSYNKIKDEFQTNIIGLDFIDNDLGSLFTLNTIGNYFQYNIVGTIFSYNTIGASASNNKIGDEFGLNSIGGGMKYNIVGNKFLGNTAFEIFSHNNIGDYFGALSSTLPNGNFILNNFSYNTIGHFFGNDLNYIIGTGENGWNIIGDNFTHNKIGNNVIYNAFGFNFRRNEIGNEFWFNVFNSTGVTQDNKFGNLFVGNAGLTGFPNQMDSLYFQNNNIGPLMAFNYIGGSFSSNDIGSYYLGNTNYDNFFSNKIGNYCGNDVVGGRSNIFSDGTMFNTLGDYFGSSTYSAGGGNIIGMTNSISYTLEQGPVLTLSVSVGGTGYADSTGNSTSGGSGSGLTVDIVTDGFGVVISASANSAGTYYAVGDLILVTTYGNDCYLTVTTITTNFVVGDIISNPSYGSAEILTDDGVGSCTVQMVLGDLAVGDSVDNGTGTIVKINSFDYLSIPDGGMKRNIIGDHFLNNMIGTNFTDNKIGNKFGNDKSDVFSESNIILDGFSSNVIANYFGQYNYTSGSGGNLIRANFIQNNIGDNFVFNQLIDTSGGGYNNNVIGYGCDGNIIYDSFNFNRIGDLFTSNIVNIYFASNTIGYFFNLNIFDEFAVGNKIGDLAWYNGVGSGFTRNEIGHVFFGNNGFSVPFTNFSYNKISSNFGLFFAAGNIIGNDFTKNSIQNAFYNNNVNDSGFKFNTTQYDVVGVDFDANPATYVYGDYSCTIYQNSGSVLRLSYYDAFDTQTFDYPYK